jgi:CheY-like chemotaxis protein
MSYQLAADIPALPRVLIADDSRIVRASLIKHIEGKFEFREALNGEEAWETLLIDPSIQVVITDLTMPKLDGYGLLQRIRASKISRIRNVPVIVISGSDESAERDRAKSLGATDLITKGIGTAQLLSRLDVLTQLGNDPVADEVEVGTPPGSAAPTAETAIAPDDVIAQTENLLREAIAQRRDFVLLNVCLGVRHADDGAVLPPAADVSQTVKQLLCRTVRQTDCMRQSGDAEFIMATSHIHFDAARAFAQRICSALANAHLIKDEKQLFLASCGAVSLSEFGTDTGTVDMSLAQLQQIARDRAQAGLRHGVSGVVGPEEEAIFRKKETASSGSSTEEESAEALPDLSTLLQWAKEGRRDEVMRHISRFSADLQPLMTMLMQESR